jgi:hypothetical protein
LQSNGVSAPTWATISASPIPTLAVLTSGTSWTAPAGVTKIKITVTGGGGGGGANEAPSGAYLFAGTGGSAAGTAIKIFTVVPGTSYTYAIGAGGTGGAAFVNGGNGGNSTFTVGGTTVTATGGLGGGTGRYGDAKEGSGATNGDINIFGGGSGSVTFGNSGSTHPSQTPSGMGGASFWGGGPRTYGTEMTGAGASANAWGAGGSGGASAGGVANGGAGKQGIIVVEY